MELTFTLIGVATFTALVSIFYWSARTMVFGALSLPSLMTMTSAIYFFLMPVTIYDNGNAQFYGLRLTTLEPVHAAVLLYAIGALGAFVKSRKSLRIDPSVLRYSERPLNFLVFRILAALAIAGVAAQIGSGRLNLFMTQDYNFSESENVTSFLVLSYSIILSLTLVVLIRQNFSIFSLMLLAAVIGVFLVVGFRFRIVILLCAAAASFMLVRKIKVRPIYVAIGTVLALIIVNFIGASRSYGRGLNLTAVEGMSWGELLQSFGGEVGLVYVLSHITTNPPDLIHFQPWIVAVTRLVPKFLWLDKPFPEYLYLYPAGFPDPGAMHAGIAAPQQVELFLQFGWYGLPFLAFLSYYVATRTIYYLHFLNRETRIAGCAIAPAFFGFFMQQRGYLFQTVCEYIFTFGPLFLLNLKTHRRTFAMKRLTQSSRRRRVPNCCRR